MASAVLAGACGAPVSEPVEVTRASGAIINGHRATPAEQWGTVGLDVYVGQNGGWSCTGTLIGPRLVVTAAHCVLPDGSGAITEMFVVAGAADLYQPAQAQVYEVARYLAHPDADLEAVSGDPTGLGVTNDIAIVETKNAVTQAAVIPVLPMDRVDAVLSDGTPLVIAGYGVTSEDDNDAFHNVGAITYTRRSDKEFLAGDSTESDTCVGDSGGPAYVMIGGAAFLVGATSRGRDDARSYCGEGGIYTLVPAYLDWIEENAVTPIGGGDGPEPEQDAGVPDDDGDEPVAGGDDSAGADGDEVSAGDGEEETPISVRKKDRGCAVRPGAAPIDAAWLSLLPVAAIVLRRRRRR